MDWIRAQPRVIGAWGFEFYVKDVQRSIAFYTQKLGFSLRFEIPQFYAQVSIGHFNLILNSRTTAEPEEMLDRRNQEPSDCERLILEVQDLPELIVELKNCGVTFRNQGLQMRGSGRRIHVEDPDGNPIELYETSRRMRALAARRPGPPNSRRNRALNNRGTVGKFP
jgi:glyoxylase I family protein